MRYLLSVLLLTLFIGVLGKPNAPVDNNPLVQITPPVAALAPVKAEPVKEIVAPVMVAAEISTDCYGAIERQFPQHLWAGAKLVVNKESSGRHAVVAPTNFDGSNDFGCFQINNKAHAAWFTTHNWQDADQSAAYGYQLYKERGNWTAWYAVQGILW